MIAYSMLCVVAVMGSVLADVAPGQNAYLPPKPGYNYDKPQQPFPNNHNSLQVPFPRPPAPYQPPKPITPSRPYQPPTNPIPRPPTGTYYQPPKNPVVRPPTGSIYQPPRPPTNTYAPSQPAPSVDHTDHHHHVPGMPFDFNYAVKEPEFGNDYSHNAASDGDVTRGEYRVQLPDGRLQIVRYTADWKEGFTAEVTYEGQAQYPDQPQASALKPSYGAPANSVSSGGYKY